MNERKVMNGTELKRLRRRQLTALTRAMRSGARWKVLKACIDAVNEWERHALPWPEDWSRWQRALDDVYPILGDPQPPQLEDLIEREET
jgi:hypothetical protein